MLADIKIQKIITNAEITPFFQFNLANMNIIIIALVAGVSVGIYNAIYNNKFIDKILHGIRDLVMRFMKRFFIPLLPLFVAGFFLKLFRENQFRGFIDINIFPFLKILLIMLLYYTFWLFISAKFVVKRTFKIFKNILPAILTGFVTMSSAVALPLSLDASEKNTQDKNLSDVVMPLTLSFHLIGDTLLVPIMCMVVLLVFNCPLPTTYEFVVFGIFFIVNQFAGAGVPNATIMLLIPVLIK